MNSTDEQPPCGPVWAAVVSAAVGCACFGFLADLTEACKPSSAYLNFYKPSGDLSGKSTVAVIVWLVAWALLHYRWKQTNIRHGGILAAASFVLIIAALVATFPPTFEMISGQ